MGSKSALALALLSTAALAAAGISLGLYITRAKPETITNTVIVTRAVTESVTRTVEAVPANNAQSRLTADGYLIWQLEALLRDTFGGSEFYLHYDDDRARFDNEFTGNCCSEDWSFTFADARRSQLRLDDPGRELPAKIGLSGGAIPLMILDRYIGCDDGRWLYTGVGNAASPNFYLFCESA
jgi:hypothetical protein